MTVTATPLSKIFNLITPGRVQRLNEEMWATASTRHDILSPDAMWSKLHSLLRAGAQIDATNHNGDTALLLLCQEAHVIPALRFLEHGASLGSASKAGTTAFLMASLAGDPDLLKGFIARGVNAHECDLQNNNAIDALLNHVPLRFASDKGHTERRIESMKVLLGIGVALKPNARMRVYCHKPEYLAALPELKKIHDLGEAANEGDGPKIRAMLASGVHPDAPVPFGDKSALNGAAMIGDEDLIDKALAAGAKINLLSGSSKLTALHVTVLKGQRGAFLRLLDRGADPSVSHDLPARSFEDPLFSLARQSTDADMPGFVMGAMIDRERDKHLSLQNDVKVKPLRFKAKDAPQ